MKNTVALAVLLSMACRAMSATHDYGMPPDWDHFKAIGEAAVRAKLPQPDLFTIEWPNGYMRSDWRHNGRVYGYMTCGLLRATSSTPGIDSVTQFEVAVSQDHVDRVYISSRETNSMVNVICADIINHGLLPRQHDGVTEDDGD